MAFLSADSLVNRVAFESDASSYYTISEASAKVNTWIRQELVTMLSMQTNCQHHLVNSWSQTAEIAKSCTVGSTKVRESYCLVEPSVHFCLQNLKHRKRCPSRAEVSWQRADSGGMLLWS